MHSDRWSTSTDTNMAQPGDQTVQLAQRATGWFFKDNVLAGIEGHDMKEVAALLEVPAGTVKSRLFVARKQLREQLSWMAAKTG